MKTNVIANLRRSHGRSTKTGQVRIFTLSVKDIRPSPENDRIYRPVNPEDPSLIALAESIEEHGVMEPLVVTQDGYILSGHRRYAAAQLAGLDEVPCRVEPIRRGEDPDAFLVRLREFNRQREKTNLEKLHEEVVTADPDEAYESLIEYRRKQSRVRDENRITIPGRKRRSRISKGKRPMLEAAIAAIESLRDFHPVSVRQIHYMLVTHPPLRHAKKPDSTYKNDKHSYKDLTDLLVRARLFGDVPMETIADDTRPVLTWDCAAEPGAFIQKELDDFLKGYWRDLMQSQPNHVELVVEKMSVLHITRQVAAQYCIPLTCGRGYAGLDPRTKMVDRFMKSGKEKLVLIMATDHDPDGESIAESFARSLRDDFHVEESRVHAVKAALTAEQVEQYNLPRNMDAKKTSNSYNSFVERYGKKAFELEALSPEQLQASLREKIDSLIDIEAFNAELEAEHGDAVFLQGVRKTVHEVLQDVGL